MIAEIQNFCVNHIQFLHLTKQLFDNNYLGNRPTRSIYSNLRKDSLSKLNDISQVKIATMASKFTFIKGMIHKFGATWVQNKLDYETLEATNIFKNISQIEIENYKPLMCEFDRKCGIVKLKLIRKLNIGTFSNIFGINYFEEITIAISIILALASILLIFKIRMMNRKIIRIKSKRTETKKQQTQLQRIHSPPNYENM